MYNSLKTRKVIVEESKAPLINAIIDARYLGTRFPSLKFAANNPKPAKFNNDREKYNSHEWFGVAKAVTNDPIKATTRITVRIIQLSNRSRQ